MSISDLRSPVIIDSKQFAEVKKQPPPSPLRSYSIRSSYNYSGPYDENDVWEEERDIYEEERMQLIDDELEREAIEKNEANREMYEEERHRNMGDEDRDEIEQEEEDRRVYEDGRHWEPDEEEGRDQAERDDLERLSAEKEESDHPMAEEKHYH